MKATSYLAALAVMVVAGNVDLNAAVKQSAGHTAKRGAPATRTILQPAGLSQPASIGETPYGRTGPGSFVPRKADSIQALVDQLKANKVVASRYARHFSTTPEALSQYFLNNLKLVRLEKPQKVTTYFVSKGGRILSRTCMLPKGTRVFATSDGRAILEWRCGNPLTHKLPSGAPLKLTEKKIPEVKVAPFEQEIGVLPAVLTPGVMAMAAPPVTMTPIIEPMLETTAAPPVAFPPILTALAPLLLGAVSVQHSQPTPPVPEPSALLSLGMGLSSALILYRTKRRIS
ncbi:MAG: PEP-CTERM sorting domain-containing protein [Armatimonadetes bacterium]|nr:PEP-CTERM sorting domain-containing protein [Armatimonadota bacterium]